MSTLLSTVDRLREEEDTARDRRRPYVGQSVLYHARPGEGRQGKLVTPALVINVEDDDHVEILILYAADDAIVKWKIGRKSDQNPVNSWSFNEYDEEHYQPGKAVELPVEKESGGQLTWEDVKVMYNEVRELRFRIAELEGRTSSATHVVLPHAAKPKEKK